jgi:hypothetical protein
LRQLCQLCLGKTSSFIDYTTRHGGTPLICEMCYDSMTLHNDTAGVADTDWIETICGHSMICGDCAKNTKNLEQYECRECKCSKKHKINLK